MKRIILFLLALTNLLPTAYKFKYDAKEVFSNVEILREMGLEAPQGLELIHELRKLGCDISGDALTEDECVLALTNFLKENRIDERN